jgi:hypothetical protein
MPSIYRTARGVQLDIDQLRLANETVVAVGNQRINARGDRLDDKGNIVKTKDDVMTEHYKSRVRNTSPTDQPIIDSSNEAKRMKADVIDEQKLQDIVASLTKQLNEKDAEVRALRATESTAPAVDSNVEVTASGLAGAIQKNTDKKKIKRTQ